METAGLNQDAPVVVSDGKLGNENVSASSTSSCRRSIFCSYWKDDDRNTPDKLPPQQRLNRSTSPRCVLGHPHIQVHARSVQLCEEHEQAHDVKVSCSAGGSKHNDPSIHKEAKAETTSRSSYDSYDSRPLSLASIWESLPAIFLEERLKVLARPIKSEPVLGSKQLKPTLRKGRFSGGSSSQCKTASVTFQPLIKVHPFEPPMDRWAESGWSKQFGS